MTSANEPVQTSGASGKPSLAYRTAGAPQPGGADAYPTIAQRLATWRSTLRWCGRISDLTCLRLLRWCGRRLRDVRRAERTVDNPAERALRCVAMRRSFGLPLYAGALDCVGALLRRRPAGTRQQSCRARPALCRDAAFIVPLLFKCLETLEVGLLARCDTDELFAQSRRPPVPVAGRRHGFGRERPAQPARQGGCRL
jgi:hypothetical protein